MSQSGFQLSNNAAALYEEQKVPAMFAPLADATLKAVPLSSDDVVLDIACGTGIMARKIRELIGPKPKIVGADLNEGMIAIAKSLPDAASQSCEWQTADATELPFEDGAFTITFCQQGMQFIPNKEAALREINRVLSPEGRVVMTVWAGMADFMIPIADALRRYVSDDIAEKAKAPFAYKGKNLLPMLTTIGFTDISIEKMTIDRVIEASESALEDEIMGLPIASAVQQCGGGVFGKIIQETLAGLSKFRQGTHFVIPQHTHLIQAKNG